MNGSWHAGGNGAFWDPHPSGIGDHLGIEEIDHLLDRLEISRAYYGFDADNTRRLYALLEVCRRPERARQSIRILAMLAHLHYCENDEFELRERSREGVELASELGDQASVRRFLAYWNQADEMHRDFQKSWAAVFVLILLGTLGAASYAIRGMIGPGQRSH
jgi:hypothetical protein